MDGCHCSGSEGWSLSEALKDPQYTRSRELCSGALHLLLHLPPGHHPSSDGVLAVLAPAQQGAVLAQVAVGEV